MAPRSPQSGGARHGSVTPRANRRQRPDTVCSPMQGQALILPQLTARGSRALSEKGPRADRRSPRAGQWPGRGEGRAPLFSAFRSRSCRVGPWLSSSGVTDD
ncbi:hypothetical protein AAFF_G00224220 [Aldrovandia affinis]|uniref:Uncharacterized protein n=1 Tax=Aldrovandia affinis TaxID=143900 RepID=A0AAD7TAV7_9TELE|nr:hypothetical protein AAFF_G00224220 [Aldrovandia affinis]